MIKLYTILFFAGSLLLSCKTASKAYDKGNYTDAVELAVKKLQKDPSDGETKALLQAAYRSAVTVSESKIRSLSAGADYEAIYNEYRSLQSLYETVRPFPFLVNLVKATDYSGYVATYGEKAADARVEKGMTAMERGDKRSFQAAYYEFRSALRFKDDATTRSRMQEAFDAGVTNVVVSSMQSRFGNGFSMASYRMRTFEEKMLRTIRNGISNEFVQLYSEDEARARRIVPDQVIELRLGRIDLNMTSDQTSSRSVTREVLVKETIFRPDSIVRQYAPVTAVVETTRRSYFSGGDLYVTILDAEGRTLWNERVSGEYTWDQEFSNYRGDSRALTDSERSKLNQASRTTKSDDEAEERVMDEIASNLRLRLRSYFSRLD
jgi:hypothetical protein